MLWIKEIRIYDYDLVYVLILVIKFILVGLCIYSDKFFLNRNG